MFMALQQTGVVASVMPLWGSPKARRTHINTKGAMNPCAPETSHHKHTLVGDCCAPQWLLRQAEPT